MRCLSCNKFVSYDEPEVEVQSGNVSGETVNGTVRIVLKCAECGEELKDVELDYDLLIEHECKKCKDGETPEFEIESEVEGEPNEHFQQNDRHGNPIKLARYRKHFYGADLTGTVKCSKCGEKITVEGDVSEQASGLNELV